MAVIREPSGNEGATRAMIGHAQARAWLHKAVQSGGSFERFHCGACSPHDLASFPPGPGQCPSRPLGDWDWTFGAAQQHGIDLMKACQRNRDAGVGTIRGSVRSFIRDGPQYAEARADQLLHPEALPSSSDLEPQMIERRLHFAALTLFTRTSSMRR